jgi:hypothetical protein
LKQKYDEVAVVNVSEMINDEDGDKTYMFPDLSEIADSLVVFDDTENIPIRSIK